MHSSAINLTRSPQKNDTKINKKCELSNKTSLLEGFVQMFVVHTTLKMKMLVVPTFAGLVVEAHYIIKDSGLRGCKKTLYTSFIFQM